MGMSPNGSHTLENPPSLRVFVIEELLEKCRKAAAS